MSTDDFISLKETGVHRIRTGRVVKIDIAGHTNWEAEVPSGRHLLAMYANLDLGSLTQAQRDGLWYGGVRTWFQQIDATEADDRDETGYDGPWPCARFGSQHQLISRTWPHTVDRDNWEFCLQLYAFDSHGNPMDFEVELETREVKLIGDRT